MSIEAKGALAETNSHVKEWRHTIKLLAARWRCSKDKASRIVNEWIKAGYAYRHNVRNEDGTFKSSTLYFAEHPDDLAAALADLGIPYPENPDTDFPDTGFQDALGVPTEDLPSEAKTTLPLSPQIRTKGATADGWKGGRADSASLEKRKEERKEESRQAREAAEPSRPPSAQPESASAATGQRRKLDSGLEIEALVAAIAAKIDGYDPHPREVRAARPIWEAMSHEERADRIANCELIQPGTPNPYGLVKWLTHPGWRSLRATVPQPAAPRLGKISVDEQTTLKCYIKFIQEGKMAKYRIEGKISRPDLLQEAERQCKVWLPSHNLSREDRTLVNDYVESMEIGIGKRELASRPDLWYEAERLFYIKKKDEGSVEENAADTEMQEAIRKSGPQQAEGEHDAAFRNRLRRMYREKRLDASVLLANGIKRGEELRFE
jgi:hypothetical protein